MGEAWTCASETIRVSESASAVSAERLAWYPDLDLRRGELQPDLVGEGEQIIELVVRGVQDRQHLFVAWRFTTVQHLCAGSNQDVVVDAGRGSYGRPCGPACRRRGGRSHGARYTEA